MRARRKQAWWWFISCDVKSVVISLQFSWPFPPAARWLLQRVPQLPASHRPQEGEREKQGTVAAVSLVSEKQKLSMCDHVPWRLLDAAEAEKASD